MNRLLKTIFVWLLLLALPMQGYAAVTMLACGTGSHHGRTVAAHDHSAHAHGAGTQAAGTHHHPAHDTGGKHGNAPCNACQGCCMGALMTSSIDWLPVDLSSTLPSASPAVLFSGHIPGGLERPPRAFLA